MYPCALLGVSLAFYEQVLGRTFTCAHGEASGFFCFRTPSFLIRCRLKNGRCLVHRNTTPSEVTMKPSARPSTHLSSMISKPMFLFSKFAVFFFAFTCSLHLLAASLVRMPQKIQKEVELYEKTQGTGSSGGGTDFVFGLLIFVVIIITFFGFYFLMIRPFIRSCRGGTNKDQNK